MAIAVRCPKCGKGYHVDDRAAGRQVKCRQCGATFPVATADADDPFAAMDALADLGRSERSAAAAPPALPLSPPPRTGTTPIRQARPVATYPRSARPPLNLELSDSAAQSLSVLLILAFVGGSIWASYAIAQLAFGAGALPDALQGGVYVVVGLSLTWKLLYFFVVLAPLMLVVCGLASSWTHWQLPDRAYVRSAGTMALPAVIGTAVLWLFLQPDRSLPLIIAILIALPFLMVLGLKTLMGLKWSTTVVAAGLLLLAVPIAGLVNAYIERKLGPAFASAGGLDEKSVRKYFAEHPDERDKYVERRQQALAERAAQRAGGTPGNAWADEPGFRDSKLPGTTGGPRFAPNTPPPPDPLVGQLEPLILDFRAALADAKSLVREDLEPKRAALARQLGAVPKPAAFSRLYEEANRLNAELAAAVAAAPSREPPAELFGVIPDRRLSITPAAPDDYRSPDLAFGNLVLRPVKGTKVDLKQYAARAKSQSWILKESPAVTLELSLEPLLDPKQQRPWLADHAAVPRVASERNLFAIKTGGGGDSSDVITGRSNGIPWTRVVRQDGGRGVTAAVYVGRLPDAWLVAKLDNQWRKDDALATADKIIGGLRLPKPGEPPVVDAFAPSEVVERFGETWDDPAAVLRQQPKEQVVAALQAYVAKSGEKAPHAARSLLADLAGKAAVPMTPREVEAAKPMEVAAALEGLASGSYFDQRKAMSDLARRTPADDAERDQVAAALEATLIKGAFFVHNEAASALSVWWRPKTVSVLLPALDEKGDRWQREAAFKVLPKTKDKSVVFPMIRWIVKEPELVVPALQEMGQVAEDDVLKLLREKDAKVRLNAARILEDVGTRKSVAELTRASKDPRDPGAAAAAKRALDAVKARASASPPPAAATSKPAAGPAKP